MIFIKLFCLLGQLQHFLNPEMLLQDRTTLPLDNHAQSSTKHSYTNLQNVAHIVVIETTMLDKFFIPLTDEREREKKLKSA